MDRAKLPRYGGCGSSQGVDAASGLLGGLSLRASHLGRRITPIDLASESAFPLIAESMKEMAAKHKHVHKQRFQLPLMATFRDTMRSAGFPDPEFSVEQRRGYFKVTIDMVVASESTSIQGDLCGSHELAEISAIEHALALLKRLQNVVLVDISARKAKAAVRASREFYLKGCDGLLQIDTMMMQWSRCLDDIELVVTFAEEHLQTGNQVQRQFTDAVHTSLLIIKGNSSVHIHDLDCRISDLRDEKDKYVRSSWAEPVFIPQFPKKKSYYYDVDALAHFLHWVNLPECVYSTEPDVNGLYLGAVQLTFPNNHTTIIWAKHHKSTTAKAHNAAAREAILYLEDYFKVDVAGYNHTSSILAVQETFVWKGLFDEIFKLGDDVLFLWEGMLKKLGEAIDRYKKARFDLAQRSRVGNEMAFINGLIQRMDLASGKCTETFKVAASKVASLK